MQFWFPTSAIATLKATKQSSRAFMKLHETHANWSLEKIGGRGQVLRKPMKGGGHGGVRAACAACAGLWSLSGEDHPSLPVLACWAGRACASILQGQVRLGESDNKLNGGLADMAHRSQAGNGFVPLPVLPPVPPATKMQRTGVESWLHGTNRRPVVSSFLPPFVVTSHRYSR